MQTYTYKFYYTNIGLNCTSLQCLKTLVQKYIARGKLIVCKNWILASLLERYLIDNEIQILDNLSTLTEWENVMFLNFTYVKLKNYLTKIRHVMVNYLDYENVRLCIHTPFRNWSLYSSQNYLPRFPLMTIEDSFVAVCVFLDDNDNTLRRRNDTTWSADGRKKAEQTKVGVHEGSRGNPQLNIIYMKMALQSVFTKRTHLVYLIETHDLSKCLHQIAEEERFLDILIPKKPDDNPQRFFHPLGKTMPRIVSEDEYLNWKETLEEYRRKYCRFCLPSPVEVSLLRRLNGPSTQICVSRVPRFSLQFNQLQSNINYFLL